MINHKSDQASLTSAKNEQDSAFAPKKKVNYVQHAFNHGYPDEKWIELRLAAQLQFEQSPFDLSL